MYLLHYSFCYPIMSGTLKDRLSSKYIKSTLILANIKTLQILLLNIDSITHYS